MIYSLYHGDEFIGVGTADELAKLIDVTPDTIRWMSTPVHKKRIVDYKRAYDVDKLGYDELLDIEDRNVIKRKRK